MKILLACAGVLERAPYLDSYIEVFEKHGIDYQVAYWDRRGKDQPKWDPKYLGFSFRQREGRRLRGLAGHFLFARFIRGLLKGRDLTHVIFFHPATGIFCLSAINGKRVLVDIRDFTFENVSLYRAMEQKLLDRADVAVISSPAYRRWLPQREYILCHNTSDTSPCFLAFDKIQHIVSYASAVPTDKSLLAFGKELSRVLKWSLVVEGSCVTTRLRRAAELTLPGRISFSGEYLPSREREIYQRCNLVFAVYSDDVVNHETLLPNKLYKAVKYGRPLIVRSGTYLGELVTQKGIGIVFPSRSGRLCEELEQYWDDEYRAQYLERCAAFLEEVNNDQKLFAQRLDEWVKID